MGSCCSNDKDVNSRRCFQLPAGSDHTSQQSVSLNGNLKSEAHLSQMRPSVAVAGEKLLFGMLVHDSRCTDPDGEGTPQQMKALEKTMAEIDAFGFKIITKSCSQATADHAGSDRSDTCLHVQLLNDGDCRSCGTWINNKIEIERNRNETLIAVNQIEKVALPTSAIKMGWVSVSNSAQLQESNKVSSSVVKEEASRLEQIQSEVGEAHHREISPAQDRAATPANIQDINRQKKEPMSHNEASSTSKQNVGCPMEQEGKEISVFLAEKYFSEDDKKAVIRIDENIYFEKAVSSSGLFFQMGRLEQRRAAYETKSESNTDLEPPSTASESDIWGSSMEDEDSLANFKKGNLQKTGFMQGTSSTLSAEGSPLGRRHEEDPMLFVREINGFEEGKKKEKLETNHQSSKLQWHLAKVNSHEFVMSPSLFSNSFACSISSPSKTDRTFCNRKQEESNNETGAHAQARDEFSFDPRSRIYGRTPQGQENTVVARDPVISHDGESCTESDTDYLKLNWALPFHAHKHSNQNSLHRDEVAVTIKSSSPLASPDYLIDHSNECFQVLDNVPSLKRSPSDLTAKSYQSPGSYLKKHGRNESDDYQSDMSTDLFEIDRLEAPSCVSSPASPKVSTCWEPITPQAMQHK